MIKKNRIIPVDTLILVLLLLLTLWVRLSTQMIIHTGVDERDYWYSAKSLSQDLPYPDLTHRTVRWGVILPTAFLQFVFGVHPNVYYVGPLLNSLVQILLLYAFGRLVKNRAVGVLSCLFLIFFPYQIRAASQVRPEIFSITYILLCVYLFMRYMGSEGKKAIGLLILSSLAMFLAYETKITNLFFLPGILLAILFIRKKNAVRDCLLFGGLLLSLFLVETGLYSIFTDFTFGHLSVISANHLKDMASDTTEPLYTFLDIFKRYSLKNLQIYWQIPFVFFAGVSVYYMRKKTDYRLSVPILISAAFFFCITFSVTSLKPLMTAELFINRYFCAVLPFVFIVISCFIDDSLKRPAWYSTGGLTVFTAATMVCTTVVFALPLVPRPLRYILHSFLKANEHPFLVTDAYYRELNEAWKNGVPIVASDDGGGTDAAFTVSWYFLDESTYASGRAPEPTSVFHEGVSVKSIASGGQIGGPSCYGVVRLPFRIRLIESASVPFITSNAFPE